MPSTYTNLGMEIQADTENDTTWGQKANNVFKMYDDAVAGIVAVVMTTGGVTNAFSNGTTDEVGRHHTIQMTSGNISAVVATMIMPAIQKTWILQNDSTAAVAVRTTTGTAFTFPSGVDSMFQMTSNTAALAMPDFYANTLNTPSGTVAAPAIRFQTDPDTGIYAPADGQWAVGVAGANRLLLTSDVATFSEPVGAPSGSAATVGLNLGESDTGFYATAAGTLSVAVNAAAVGTWTSDGYGFPSGAVGTPALSFVNDRDTGIYSTATGTFSIAVNGVQVMRITATGVLVPGGAVQSL